MKCPFMTGIYLSSCSANKEVYVPSRFELEEYCRDSRHRMCPFYCAAEVGEYQVMSDRGRSFPWRNPTG
jgi:hypothetical protein